MPDVPSSLVCCKQLTPTPQVPPRDPPPTPNPLGNKWVPPHPSHRPSKNYHTLSARTPSSKRTVIGGSIHGVLHSCIDGMKRKNVCRCTNTNNKKIKQQVFFVSLPNNKSCLAMTPSVVRGLCLAVDCGCAGSTPIQRPSAEDVSGDARTWMRLSTTGQDLHVLDCRDPHR